MYFVDFPRQPAVQPGQIYSPYGPMYQQPLDRQHDYQSEAAQYDPTQPQPQQNYYEEQIHPGFPENEPAPQSYNFPSGGYPQQTYAGFPGQHQNNVPPEMGNDLVVKDLGGDPSLLGLNMNIRKEEKNAANIYGNSGFNQALGLAPQPEDESDNLESRGFGESEAKSFAKF